MFEIIENLTEEFMENEVQNNKKVLFLYSYLEQYTFKKTKIYKDIIKDKEFKVYIIKNKVQFLIPITENIHNTYLLFKNKKLYELGVLI